MPNIDTSQMLPKGTLLHDNAYRIDSYLASGGFGNTYLATNIAFDEKVAIKEFFLRGQSERTDDMLSVRVTRGQELFFDEQKRKFVKEAQRIRRLRNPHIVRVHDLFEANGTAYYVMDYIDGESVAARIKRTGKPFSEEKTRNILTQVLDALTEVHEAGIYHLDIKPDNILLDRKGNAYLIDFGASKVQSQSGDGVNCTSAFSATPEYAPLELTDGNIQNIGAWTDIYSIGATAYRMLTGVVPPRSSEVVIRGSEAFRFTDAVSQSMQKFISTCMAGDYRKRPQTAAAVIEMLSVKPQVVEQPKKIVVEQPKPQVVERPKPQVVEPSKPQLSRTSDSTKILGEERKKTESVKAHKSYGALIFCSLIIAIITTITIITSNSEEKIDSSNDALEEEYGPLIEEYEPEVGEDTEDVAEEEEEVKEVLYGEKVTFTVNDVAFIMIRVEGGRYSMGATSEQGSDAYDNEKPVHSVSVETFYIGETEVTQELWQAVMGNNPSCFLGSLRPVEKVSWNDCQTFISKLNSLTDMKFRMPTEEEWEFAARGGNKSRYTKYSGSSDVGAVAWYRGNSDSQTHEVKTRQPNELGIYDMSGNVCEWTSSYWCNDYNGMTDTSYRVGRGGSWYNSAKYTRVSYRPYDMPSRSYNYLGLRLALSPNDPETEI